MNSAQGKLMHEGKAKKVFETDDNDVVLVEFKNDTTAFNALKHQKFDSKGETNCQISARIFEFLEKQGIPTHYICLVNSNSMLAHRVEVIPLEVVIRNVAAGSLCKETPINPGEVIHPPLMDLYYKDDKLSDPLLTESRLHLLGLLNTSQRKELEDLANRVNHFLKHFLDELDLLLVDFKIEIGLDKSGKLVVADEISPDSCRIWDKTIDNPNERILDKDRFRKDLGGVVEAYREILKRIQGVTPNPRNCG